jgi:hypothetical protein
MKLKMQALHELFDVLNEECFESEDYKEFHERINIG